MPFTQVKNTPSIFLDINPEREVYNGCRGNWYCEKGATLGLVALFYYTLIILLVSIMTSAMCLSTYLVSHRKSLAFAFVGFLFYFFDVTLVFLDDFTMNSAANMPESVYFIGSQAASIITGCGLFTAFWLLVCDAFNEQRRPLLAAPPVIFVLASILIYIFMPAGNTHLFVFYGMRTVYLMWILGYIAVRYLGQSGALRERMWRYRLCYVGTLILGAAVFIENIVFLFYIDPVLVESGAVPFFPERNFAENALMLWLAAFVATSCWKLLSIHFEKPPAEAEGRVGAFINAGLAGYAQHYSLSARETEVLRLVLEGKDNQNIAGELSLAASTVKVHVHNILKKTGQANRQELMRDFRKVS